MKPLLIYPTPKKVEYMEGTSKKTSEIVKIHKEYKNEEEYRIEIKDDTIKLFGSDVGLFRAETTLKLILSQCNLRIPNLKIKDSPDFSVRGVMLDISRSKIPSMDTLYHIIDILADLKINQLQLYIEGFSFAYESFPDVWKDQTPVKGEEILEIDRYCRERYIELVPNQNSFGHMGPWLAREEFKDLAECPEGFEFQGTFIPTPLCLNPLDDRSFDFVKTLYDDLLPYFSSDKFNVGCDETLELGKGKSKSLCEEVGVGRVYKNFLMKIYEDVKRRGKTMMFWGDIILSYPELIPELPKDVIALNWGYLSTQPTEASCKIFKEANIPFYTCPGTASWNSIWGQTDQMITNIDNAARYGKKHGAIGLLNTDWGDNGHLQYLPVSYAGFAYGAAMSWNTRKRSENYNNLPRYLNKFIFEDESELMGNLVLEAGLYHTYEEIKQNNITNLVRVLYSPLDEKESVKGTTSEHIASRIYPYINKILYSLNETKMKCKDENLIIDEYINSGRMLKFACHLACYKLGYYGLLDSFPDSDMTKDEFKSVLLGMQETIMDEHKRLWKIRNRKGGLEDSLRVVTKILPDN